MASVDSAKQDETLSAISWQLMLVYFCNFKLILFSAMITIPVASKVNLSKNGDENETSSEASFVISTAYFLKTAVQFLSVKYVSALSDFVGRKPLIIVNCLATSGAGLMFAMFSSDGMIYVASMLSGLVPFLSVLNAWICDLVEESERAKALSINLGMAVGIGFAVGIQVSAVLTGISGPKLPLYVVSIGSVVMAVVVLFLPVGDTHSSILKAYKILEEHRNVNETETVLIKDDMTDSSSTEASNRRLPANWGLFFYENNPFTGFSLIWEAKHPEDWCSVFFIQISAQVAITVLLSYCIEVFAWSTSVSGIAMSLFGALIAINAPIWTSRYTEHTLFPATNCVKLFAFTLLAVAGTGIPSNTAVIIGVPGLFLYGCAGFVASVIQAILSQQYGKDRQGECSGVISQLMQLAVVPAYGISLIFSFTLSEGALFYWPGIVFAFCGLCDIISTTLFVHTYGLSVLTLQRRQAKNIMVDPNQLEDSLINENDDIKSSITS